MTASLERLLVRYEYGRLAPELFDIELRAALATLGEGMFDVERGDAVVRLWNSGLMEGYQRTYKAAVDAVDWCRYRDAVQSITECTRRAAAIRGLVAAAHDADLAEEAALAVHEIAAIPRLQRLPAVAATAQIVDLARRTIVDGHYTRASAIAAICSRMAAALVERRRAATEEAEWIDAASADVRTLCEATRAFAPPEEGDAAAYGSLEHIAQLVNDGYARLAKRLVAELQMELAGRRRFLALYERRGAMTLAFGSREQIRVVVADRSWDGAFDYYCEAALAEHSRTVESLTARAAAAQAAVHAAIESITHADA
ncbi:MAG TPA: hypothetical protein VJZ00_11745 [Thermoanaerobaculia bacterium]|nr:hypothetical protein [Thermoanaerobaculia bacterium]